MRHSTLLTEFTDISQRLEYLVAHSSQMIFVTGEDLAIQQGFVEAFLGQQSTHANVAFLTASRNKNAQYYRQQLAEQLHFELPRAKQTLAQQFAARTDKNEPVIIAMTSAENIPEDILRELWDLVLQNRFTRNGEQINILMFGDQEWAEEVKSWLPTNNNDKPVLLTTQTLEYDEETEVAGDLDDMIANRRKLFKERMKSRAQSQGDSESLLNHWWMRLVLVGVFLISFASILIWQYFDVTKNALDEFTQFFFQQSSSETSDNTLSSSEELLSEGLTLEQALELEQGSATNDVDNSNQRVAANFAQAMERIEALDSQKQAETQPEEVIDTSVNIRVNETADSPNSVTIAEITTAQLIQLRDGGSINAAPDEQAGQNSEQLVTQPATTELDMASTGDNSLVDENMVIEELPADAKDIALQESIFEAIVALEAMELETGAEMSAFQLENELVAQQSTDVAATVVDASQDALVEEQLVQTSATPEVLSLGTLGENTIAQGSENPEGSQVQDYRVRDVLSNIANAAQQAASRDTSIVPAANSTQQNTYQFHEQLLLELPNDSYVLQLSGITTESLLEEYLVDNRMLNSVWVYKTQRYGGDWFVVLLNQSFNSLASARSGVSLLSTDLQSVSPFAKSVSQIKNEILSN